MLRLGDDRLDRDAFEAFVADGAFAEGAGATWHSD